MLIKIAPKGEKVINLYKQYSGETRGVLLVRFLEEGVKRDKGFQEWLKERAGTKENAAPPNTLFVEDEPVPTKPAKAIAPTPSATVEAVPPARPTPAPASKKSGYDENELR